MNVAQEIVARLYLAGPEVSDPPEVIGPVGGVAYPAGTFEAGSSTDSSCVPVSWPDAAGSGVVDVVGVTPEAAEVAGAVGTPAEVAEGADVVGTTADDEELAEDEHPASVISTPAMTPSAPKARRSP
jgi:hypothetical protein